MCGIQWLTGTYTDSFPFEIDRPYYFILSISHMSRFIKKKEPAKSRLLFFYVWELVVLLPLLDLGLSQTLNVLGGVDGSLAANAVDKVQALGSLEQSLLITGGIAEGTDSVLLDHGCGLGIVQLLANGLLHGMNLLSF